MFQLVIDSSLSSSFSGVVSEDFAEENRGKTSYDIIPIDQGLFLNM